MRSTTTLASLLLASTALVCGACASTPPPNDAWAAAQGDIGRAQASGAADVPDAKLHLKLAQEDLQMAKRILGSDDARAASLIEVARVEAQLASSLAKASAAEGAESRAADDLRKAGAQ